MAVNQLKAGVVLTYTQMLLSNVISLAYTPVMLRLLGQTEYGLISIAGSLTGYLQLMTFGISNSYIRYHARARASGDSHAEQNLNGLYAAVCLLTGAATFLVGMLLACSVKSIFGAQLRAGEAGEVRTMVILLSAYTACYYAANVFSLNITANQKFFFCKAVAVANTVLGTALQLPILLMGYKSVGLVAVTAAVGFLTIGLNIFYSIRFLKIKISFGRVDRALLREILVFSFFVFLNMISDQVNWNADKLLLGMFAGPASVAVYTIGAQLNLYYILFSVSISDVFIPRVNLMEAQNAGNRALSELMTRVGRIQFFVLSLILTGFIFFGRPFIVFWAGPDYAQAYYIALLLLVPVTVPQIQSLGIEIQMAKNRHKFRSVLYACISAGNILLSILLCRRWGGIGCAIGTAAAILLGNCVIMNIYYQRGIGLDMKTFWREIAQTIPAFVLPVCLGILSLMFVRYGSLWKLMLFGLLYVFAFCFSFWMLGLNESEKALFSAPAKKALRRIRRFGAERAGEWKQ